LKDKVTAGLKPTSHREAADLLASEIIDKPIATSKAEQPSQEGGGVHDVT
jgi:hypothetical protein